MKYATRQTSSAVIAHLVTAALIDRSVWFSVTPLPFDWYEIRVKGADEDVLVTEVANANEAGVIRMGDWTSAADLENLMGRR